MPNTARSCLIAQLLLSAILACREGWADDRQEIRPSLSLKIEDFTEGDLLYLTKDPWAKFDTYAGEHVDHFGEPFTARWYLEFSPPFPINWPPRAPRGLTYYGYAENQTFARHCPVWSRSAPVFQIVLEEGSPIIVQTLVNQIGPSVSAEASRPIPAAASNRYQQILADGKAYLPRFKTWTAVPTNSAEVMAVKDYHCQWALTNQTAALIQKNHQDFFDWLACPPPSWYPVLLP